MRLIVGLGNPGAEYRKTRHNLGFAVVEALAAEARTGDWTTQCQSLVCTARAAGQDVLLAKPLTFMNLSGRAVHMLMTEHRLGPADLIVVYDDLDLPFGRIRVRERGTAGGHNGMESVLRAIESEEVVRVRLGIGEENMPEDKAQFVLSDFPAEREVEAREMIVNARDAVKAVLSEGISHAMSVFNA